MSSLKTREELNFAGRMTVANSKSPKDYVRKVNGLYDIYLKSELHHLESERRFYLKNFRIELRLAKEKRDAIASKAQVLRRPRALKPQEPLEETRKEDEFFITASAESESL